MERLTILLASPHILLADVTYWLAVQDSRDQLHRSLVPFVPSERNCLSTTKA